jgi:hypothetical protein
MYSKNPLVQRIHELLANTKNSYLLCWIPSHIGMRGNETVDTMAKVSLLEAPVSDYKPSKIDLKSKINSSIIDQWKLSWTTITDNKLKVIKKDIGPWKNIDLLNRKESVVLTRLRIGHTHLTHKFLMEKSPPPQCQCGNILTIHHIFGDCVRTSGLRGKCSLNIRSLASNDVRVMRNIFSFLVELHLCDKI